MDYSITISIFCPNAWSLYVSDHEFCSSFDICHPGSVWVVLCNLQDYHTMISIFCPNGQFTNLIIPLEEFQNSGRKVFRLSMNFHYHLTVVPPFNSSI
jgi:hypothetical protein